MNTRRPAPRNPRRPASLAGSGAPPVAVKPSQDDAREGIDDADDAPRPKRKGKPAEQEGKTSDRDS